MRIDHDGINAERKSLGIRNYRYCSSAKLRFTSNAHEPPVTNHCMLNYNRRNRSISCCFPITRPPYCALPSDNDEKNRDIFLFSFFQKCARRAFQFLRATFNLNILISPTNIHNFPPSIFISLSLSLSPWIRNDLQAVR